MSPSCSSTTALYLGLPAGRKMWSTTPLPVALVSTSLSAVGTLPSLNTLAWSASARFWKASSPLLGRLCDRGSFFAAA